MLGRPGVVRGRTRAWQRMEAAMVCLAGCAHDCQENGSWKYSLRKWIYDSKPTNDTPRRVSEVFPLALSSNEIRSRCTGNTRYGNESMIANQRMIRHAEYQKLAPSSNEIRSWNFRACFHDGVESLAGTAQRSERHATTACRSASTLRSPLAHTPASDPCGARTCEKR